jgi:TonB family protein
MMPNPSNKRTNNGGHRLRVFAYAVPPLVAANLQRQPSDKPPIMRTTCSFLAVILLSACATPRPNPPTSLPRADDYQVDGRKVQGAKEGARLISEKANLAAAAQTSEAERSPRLINSVAPAMPRQAIAQNIQGDVTAELVVESNGTVSSIKILRSPDTLLSQAVIEAMKQWTFSPLIVNGAAKQFKATQTYTFRIEP